MRDHVIVGSESTYYSFVDAAQIPRPRSREDSMHETPQAGEGPGAS